MTLASMLRDNWSQVSNSCGASLANLERAEVLSDELSRIIGVREDAPPALVNATLLRKRVYSLFVRAYTEVREAVQYVRKANRDADKFAPSLYLRRKRVEHAPVVTNTNVTNSPLATTTSDSREGDSSLHQPLNV